MGWKKGMEDEDKERKRIERKKILKIEEFELGEEEVENEIMKCGNEGGIVEEILKEIKWVKEKRREIVI